MHTLFEGTYVPKSIVIIFMVSLLIMFSDKKYCIWKPCILSQWYELKS